ncbi:unnamed protein product [Moneuplotes crassus]|uniref:Uncharacterized protein n=1 Tax=Euplotes crassus TaxID=5936 RepID=A0AAD1XSM3_EUPCR|nr:unnamed protein product [Moneuplotes crassus]
MEQHSESEQVEPVLRDEKVVLRAENECLLACKYQRSNLCGDKNSIDLICGMNDQRESNCLKECKLKSRTELYKAVLTFHLSKKKKLNKYADSVASFQGIPIYYFELCYGRWGDCQQFLSFKRFAPSMYRLIPNITMTLILDSFKITQKQLIRVFSYIKHLDIFRLSCCYLEPITDKFVFQKQQSLDELVFENNLSYKGQFLRANGPELRSIFRMISNSNLQKSLTKICLIRDANFLPSSYQPHTNTTTFEPDTSLLQLEYNLPHIKFEFILDF